MRSSLVISALLSALLSANVMAFETVKPHAMFYVHVPFAGSGPAAGETTFGLRLDNIHVDYSDSTYIDFTRQIGRPAVLDFRMGRKGLDGIYIAGTDYLRLYRVNRQNAEEGEEVEMQTDEEAAAEAMEEEVITEEEAMDDYEDALPLSDRIRGVFADMRNIAPMGLWIGAGLGIGLLLGVDD